MLGRYILIAMFSLVLESLMSALVHTTVHVHTYVLVTHKYLAHGYHYYSHLRHNALLEDCCGFTLIKVHNSICTLLQNVRDNDSLSV